MSIENKIVNDILMRVGKDNKSDWYVGIATDIRGRLFSDHNVSEYLTGGYIYMLASSEQNARDTEEYLLNTYKFKGGIGGGLYPKYVYAYKITSYTRE